MKRGVMFSKIYSNYHLVDGRNNRDCGYIEGVLRSIYSNIYKIYRFYPEIGGAERQALLLTRYLQKKYVNVRILTTNPGGLLKYEVYDEIDIYRLKIHGWYIFRQLWLVIAFAVKLIIMRNEFDIIHTHGAKHTSFSSCLVGKLLRKPTITKVTNSGYRFDFNVLERWYPVVGKFLSNFISRNNSLFVAITPTIKEELIKYGVSEKKIVVIANGVETGAVGQVDLNNDKSGRSYKVGICVASLTTKKNLSVLLGALSLIPKDLSYRFYIIGDGPQRGSLEKQAKALGLFNNVQFVGISKNVDEYYAKADVFVLPSLTEGLSNSLLEAMSIGLPCVVSNIPGNVLCVENGKNGFVINPNSMEELAIAISKLLSNKILRNKFSTQSLEKVRMFSIESVSKKYINLYNNLLDMVSIEN